VRGRRYTSTTTPEGSEWGPADAQRLAHPRVGQRAYQGEGKKAHARKAGAIVRARHPLQLEPETWCLDRSSAGPRAVQRGRHWIALSAIPTYRDAQSHRSGHTKNR